jgi:hypothetical protein
MSGSQITSPFGDPNILWKGLSGEGLIANQNALLVNQAAQQNLTDRATLRGLASGLATRDPNAVAGAAVLPGIGGTQSITALTGQDDLAIRQQELGLKLAMIRASQSSMDAVYPGADSKPQSKSGPDVGPFEQQMGTAESSDRPGITNRGGYIGQFQFGAPRLSELGIYTPGQGEDVKSNQFGGSFNVPGFPEVKTKADFLASPGAQHAAFGAHVKNIDAAIAQTPGADKFDANGLRAVAHLGGVEGMQKFIASGGHYDPADSNGTHLSDYYLKFGAGGPAALQTAFGSQHGPAGPPVATADAAALPAGTQVAGPGAGPSVATPDAAPGADPAADLMGPRPLPPQPAYGLNAPTVTPQSLANTPVNGIAGPELAQQPPQQMAQAAPPPAPVQMAQAAPQPLAPQGFQAPRADAAQPVAPVTDANGLTEADHTALAGMKQAFKSQLNPNGAQLLQAEIDKRQATNRALSVAAWNAANPNIRATPVQGVGPNGEPGTWMVQGKNIAGFIPSTTRPAGGSYDIAKASLEADRPKIDAIAQAGQASQAGMLRLNEMANIIPRLATGPLGELKTKGAALLESLGASDASIKKWTGMESGSLAEELIKLSIATVGQAAKSDIGSNVGIQSLQLYQSSNPGMALLPGANKKMTNMLRVSSQMAQDYTNGALEHFNPQQAALMKGGTSYSPISDYNQSWQQRNNPQIGAAAMGILNGDTYDKWAERLRDSPDQAAAAVAMAFRIDPNAMVPTANGMKSAKDILAHPTLPAPR